jgi:aspartate/methionine/tyrosine aminotransferase
MTGPSARFASYPRSGIRDAFERALLVPGAVHLELGAPDFPTPPHVVEAAARAAADGFTSYTPAAGLPSLRELAAEKVRASNGFACSPEEVVVSAGGCCGLYATLLVLLDEGDGVLVPDPGWPVCPAIVEMLGGTVERYPLAPDLDLDAVEASITPRTRVLVVNTPGNPTGVVHARETLEALLELAERRDLWVISDEAYEDFVFEGEHVSTASLGGNGRVVTVFTLSKTYAMTGWRVGYVVAPAPIAAAVAQAQEPLIACPSSVSQKAAEAALVGPRDAIASMCAAFAARRDLAASLLAEAGVPYVRPQGGFFLLAGLPGDGGDSLEFSRAVLAERHVAVVPGSAFGQAGEGMIRVSLCVDESLLEEGLARLLGPGGDGALPAGARREGAARA